MPTPPATPSSGPVAPVHQIADGGEAGSDPDFQFLPPITGAEPGTERSNEAAFLPYLIVEICPWDGEACVEPPVARFTASGRGPGRIRANRSRSRGHFLVNLDTRAHDLAPGSYRLFVWAGRRDLGHADLVVVRDRRRGRAMERDGAVALVEGQTLPVRFRVFQDRIEGEPGALLATNIPYQRYDPESADFSRTHPDLPGAPISPNTLALSLLPEATIGDANALLNRIDGAVVGAIPSPTPRLPAILFVQLPFAEHEPLIALLEELDGDPLVRTAVQDALLGPAVVSDETATTSGWQWEEEPRGGNWGFEVSRVPEMWNLNPGIAKAGTATLTGVVDVGFADAGEHEDLVYDENLTPGERAHHGTHVAGTIGATFANGLGVDGLNPWARLVVKARDLSPTPQFSDFRRRASWGRDHLQAYLDLMNARPAIRVVNMSLGYGWGELVDEPAAQRIATDQGGLFTLAQTILEFRRGGTLPVVVVSAGNDRGERARYGSAMANAGLVWDNDNVLVVEALGLSSRREPELAAFSNVGGHFSAPGAKILSTVLPPTKYFPDSGTSMAAPHVAGMVGYLYALDATLPLPGQFSNPIRALLTFSSIADVDGAAPRIDAFAAAMNVDRFNDDDRVLRLLLDVDDGSVDGNLRVAPDGSEVLDEDMDGDGGQGDGRIDMSDFRRWRDWWLQVRYPTVADLDGADDHPKKDGNGNGRVEVPIKESRFSRGDFNGNRRISPSIRAPVPGALDRAELSDLEVLESRFSDPHYAPDQLEGLVDSGDLVIDAGDCLGLRGAAAVRTTVRVASGSPASQSRTHTPGAPSHLYTVPVVPGEEPTEVSVSTSVLNGAGDLISVAENTVELGLGSDRSLGPACRFGTVVSFDDQELTGDSEVIDPFVDPGTGIEFTADVPLGSDGVTGLVLNSATPACVEPKNDDVKLGTGVAGQPGSIGTGAFPIHATFPEPLQAGSEVSADFQVFLGQQGRVRLFDANGKLVGSAVVEATEPAGDCGSGGGDRSVVRVTANAQVPVSSAVLDTYFPPLTNLPPPPSVFVIDRLEVR